MPRVSGLFDIRASSRVALDHQARIRNLAQPNNRVHVDFRTQPVGRVRAGGPGVSRAYSRGSSAGTRCDTASDRPASGGDGGLGAIAGELPGDER
jgi:hypothetical protein